MVAPPPRIRQSAGLLARLTLLALLSAFAFGASLVGAAVAAATPAGATTARERPAIIGGTAASRGAAPWVAYVENTDAGFACTGSVISTNLILTAGHCAEDLSTGAVYAPGGYFVVTGTTNLASTSGTVSDVSRVIVFPGYDHNSQEDDAALLELATPTTAPAIALATPDQHDLLAPGTTAYIAGWGVTSPDAKTAPTALQIAELAIEDTNACQQQILGVDPLTAMCAVDSARSTSSACYGDSGGPIVVSGPGRQPIEVGITSRGDSQCSTSVPSVFTRADAISPWANDLITELKPAPKLSPTKKAKTTKTTKTTRTKKRTKKRTKSSSSSSSKRKRSRTSHRRSQTRNHRSRHRR